ncbi:TadE/TadG family type IV pilus assembly protein [uncultured Brevundimonas sp.]|uniref:TadE/TadG family type IV pilus assembly protein n=1 Tax=uncultured Brevundimonas sp. TaxID=213418 RepID=UPI0030ED67D2|tara:strand:+ start:397 stop:948 length:552 start_codon:yes stop_codon:yes gene_type:complete
MTRPTAPSRPGRRRRTGFWRARDGSTAVEFAMVALPFFFMMFAILELGLVFVIDSVLENATAETSRLIRTGRAENSGMTAEQFKTSLCGRMSIFQADCNARATVDVRVIPNFSTPNPPDPMASGSFQTSDLGYDDGTAGSTMLIRVWYKQPLVTPFMNEGLSRLKDGSAYLTSTAVFRNEPFI